MLDFTGLRALRSRSLRHGQRAVAVIAGIMIAFLPKTALPISRSTEFYSSSVLLAQETDESEASRLLIEGVHLAEPGTEDAHRDAIQVWQRALELSRQSEHVQREATALRNIGTAYVMLREPEQALMHLQQSLQLPEHAQEPEDRLFVIESIAYVYQAIGSLNEALNYLNQGLELARETGNSLRIAAIFEKLESIIDYLQEERIGYQQTEEYQAVANLLFLVARSYDILEDSQEALGYYIQYLDILERGDLTSPNREDIESIKHQQAFAYLRVGRIYYSQNNLEQAIQYYNDLSLIARSIQDIKVRAFILTELGVTSIHLEYFDRALNFLDEALSLSNEDASRQADIFDQMGVIYSLLGDHDLALEYLKRAVGIRLNLEQGDEILSTLTSAVAVYSLSDDYSSALDIANYALQIFNANIDNFLADENSKRTVAILANNIAQIYHHYNDAETAISLYAIAFQLSEEVGDQKTSSLILDNIGQVNHYLLGNRLEALKYYAWSLLKRQETVSSIGEATTRHNIAFLYFEESEYEEALKSISTSIDIVENIRSSVRSNEFKATYFSTVQDVYQLAIDILMKLDRQDDAFDMSERSRARSLIELLAESNLDLSQGADNAVFKDLLEREKGLSNQLEAQYNRLGQITNEYQSEAWSNIRTLQTELESIKRELRINHTAYADLQYPEPLTLEQIQQHVLDDETVLLQYSLGKRQSYLWIVSKQGELQSYVLPPRAEIEQAVQDFRKLILETRGNLPQEINQSGKPLAAKILPVEAMTHLQGKRLVIAADGALQTLPFAALPNPTSSAPNSEYVPLIKTHEIVNIPSATAIATQRQEIDRQQQAGNRNPSRVLAAIANPVFAASTAPNPTESQRSTAAPSPTTLEAITLELEQWAAERSLQNLGQPLQLKTLPNTEEVANAIMALIPNPNQTTERFGYAANQDWLMQAPLDQYRYLFFGTHGFADNINPELSFIALSLFNQQGQPIDGYLRLNEIFNLKLSADVVVLNACQTGLGQDMRGEGIIGLTRGFMYAGAKSMVASLWDVSATDQTTQLMTDFFAQLLSQEGRQPSTPASALRSAQLKLRETHPNDPNYWAAFTLQGDWR